MNRESGSLVEYLLKLLSLTKHQRELFSSSPQYAAAMRFKEFLDEIPGGFLIYRASEDERILYANRALLKIFGCENDEEFGALTSNSFKGMVYSEDLDAVEASINEQIENSQDLLDYVEYRIMRKDGAIRWVEDYGHYVRSKAVGDIFYVFISDATEKINRRQMLISASEEHKLELQTLTERFDQERDLILKEHLQRLEVIEGLSVNYDSILYADLDSEQALPYRLSHRLEGLFEHKLQVRDYRSFLQAYARDWIHPEDREIFLRHVAPEYIRKALKKTNNFHVNYRCIENGEPKYLQLHVVNVGSSEQVCQIVMGLKNVDDEIMHEIKQRQLLQQTLYKAKLADVAKNSFLSNMSHDMRTPLNAIFGYTSLAEKADKAGANVGEYLEKINVAARQILDLVEKVLEISYTESQDLRITEDKDNIRSIIDRVGKSLSPQANSKNVEIVADSSDIIHEDIFCDSEKVVQTLSHILNNAVKYTDGGGKASISVHERTSSRDGFAAYDFVIEDNGIGIHKDFLPKLFEPFEREKNTTLAGTYGVGLGLTITKQLVDAMGGDIRVESAEGKGSKFTVSLSFRIYDQNARADLLSESQLKEYFSGKQILVVEDNEINLEIETELLSSVGFETDCAANGKIALEKVQSDGNRYGLILMDIQMPVMDGRQTAKAIRSLNSPSLSAIPIIALSANAFESDKRESAESGMDAHLTKPLDMPLLLKTMRDVLKHRMSENRR